MGPSLSHPIYIALKGSLAALLALIVVRALKVPDTLSATFVAVACVTPTVYSGLRRGLQQIAASTVGGLVGFALALVFPKSVALTIALFVTIALCFRVGFGQVFLVAAFTVLYVLLLPGETATTLRYRLTSVAVGVLSAITLNLIVSASRFRSVFARRLQIARERVGAEYRLLAAVLAQGAKPDNAGQRAILFETVFPMLRTLFEELSDAARDSRVRVGPTRAAIESAQRAAHHLLSVAHYGKDLVLGLELSPGPFPLGGQRAEQLGNALVLGRAIAPPELGAEEDVRRSLSAGARAWGRVLQAMHEYSIATGVPSADRS